MSAISDFVKRSLYHGYLPATPAIHKRFLEDHFGGKRSPQDTTAAVKAFLKALDDLGITKEVVKVFDTAVTQADQYNAWADPNENYRVTSFDDFINKVNVIVGGPPQFYTATAANNVVIGEPIGVPIYLVLDLISNTSAAYTLLTWDEFNQALKALLDGWGDYLKDPTGDSNKTLTSDQWFSSAGLNLLQSGLGTLTFEQTYQSDSSTDPLYYTTWDSFFTRQFNAQYTDPNGNLQDVRPIAPQPTSGDIFYIYNSCEGTVLRVALNVQAHDTFWLKTQDYSLFDMLGGSSNQDLSSYADRLKGGAILQNFLSPQDYHRWHSPIQGKVLKSGVIEGTYYAVLPDKGAGEEDTDLLPGDPHGALIRSQPWLSASATRAVFIIEPTDANSPIDLVAVIPIGMAEVSTCEITYDKRDVPEPDLVEVGDQLGSFHFGGSSQTLIVKPKLGHYVAFQDIFNSAVRPCQHRWINSVVGQIFKRTV